MNINDYSAKLCQLADATPQNLAELALWTEKVALPWLWDELGGAIWEPKQKHPQARTAPTRPTLKRMTNSEAVRHGLMTSVADQLTKAMAASLYQAQMTMLDSEARRYCTTITSFGQTANPFAADAAVHTLHRALLEFMTYAHVLLEDAGREVTEVSGFFGAWRKKQEHPFEVFKGTEQVIYGTYSGMTHVDRAPYIPVAVLRTAIELRLRHAFCIYSLVDPAKPEDTVPIDMSRIFAAMQERQTEVEFAVDMHDVWKIYRWSNFYLHGGVRDFPWVAGFLLQYLRPLFADEQDAPNGSWSINGGIRMKRETWHAVRAQVAAPKEALSLGRRFANAWQALCPPKKTRILALPPYEENVAQCIFLD
jgi:hypothetical protein